MSSTSTAASTRRTLVLKSGCTLLDDPGPLKLWRMVVYQALYDAFLGGGRERQEAIRWLSSRDFEECADLAQLIPAHVRSLAEQLWVLPRDEQVNFLHQLRAHLDRKT